MKESARPSSSTSVEDTPLAQLALHVWSFCQVERNAMEHMPLNSDGEIVTPVVEVNSGISEVVDGADGYVWSCKERD